jgi:hypothetical protein
MPLGGCHIVSFHERVKMANDERTIPLKELVPFDVFQQIFEKMMENIDSRMEEGDDPWLPGPYDDDME